MCAGIRLCDCGGDGGSGCGYGYGGTNDNANIVYEWNHWDSNILVSVHTGLGWFLCLWLRDIGVDSPGMDSTTESNSRFRICSHAYTKISLSLQRTLTEYREP